jgi:hypothetical protein
MVIVDFSVAHFPFLDPDNIWIPTIRRAANTTTSLLIKVARTFFAAFIHFGQAQVECPLWVMCGRRFGKTF